jgi:hypothetical protein
VVISSFWLGRLLLFTSGVGLGVMGSLPLVAWVLFSTPTSSGRAVCSRLVFAATSVVLVSVLLGACILLAFQLASFSSHTTLATSSDAAFQWLCGGALGGFAVPGFAAIVATYDWTRNYEVPALRKFGKRFGFIALVISLANIGAHFLVPVVEPIVFLGSLLFVGLWAVAALDKIRKRPHLAQEQSGR